MYFSLMFGSKLPKLNYLWKVLHDIHMGYSCTGCAKLTLNKWVYIEPEKLECILLPHTQCSQYLLIHYSFEQGKAIIKEGWMYECSVHC